MVIGLIGRKIVSSAVNVAKRTPTQVKKTADLPTSYMRKNIKKSSTKVMPKSPTKKIFGQKVNVKNSKPKSSGIKNNKIVRGYISGTTKLDKMASKQIKNIPRKKAVAGSAIVGVGATDVIISNAETKDGTPLVNKPLQYIKQGESKVRFGALTFGGAFQDTAGYDFYQSGWYSGGNVNNPLPFAFNDKEWVDFEGNLQKSIPVGETRTEIIPNDNPNIFSTRVVDEEGNIISQASSYAPDPIQVKMPQRDLMSEFMTANPDFDFSQTVDFPRTKPKRLSRDQLLSGNFDFF